jgi:hypothetical protein
MTTVSQPRAFQPYNNYKTSPIIPIKKPVTMLPIDESLAFSQIPYTSIRINTKPVPSSPDGVLKSTPIGQKRRSSTMSLGTLFAQRKSLQTTAIATRRQSLWMNISKNPSTTDEIQPSLLPLRQDHSSLMRKKFLRLLLVFSYLLSISLFAIALATFYGFFWTGYSRSKTSNESHNETSVRSLISLTTNSTYVDSHSEIKDE